MVKSDQTLNYCIGTPIRRTPRTAKSKFLEEDDNNKHLNLVNRRGERMTGVTMNTAEILQVAYYDYG